MAPTFFYVPSIGLYVARKKKLLGKNWHESHKGLQENREIMLPIPEFVEVLKYTRENEQEVYRDITEVRSPWRCEWLDADFKFKDSKLYINSGHRYQGGELIPQNSEILAESTLIENKIISLESWLENPTKQGLPSRKTESGDLCYWSPMRDNNSVAWFDADFIGAYFGCSWDPSSRNSVLGVRAAKLEL
ncbi:MAG: hypothetical protein IH845_04955 [Nanoarchaeota archaeon]|nr:hypothetical protein [Nanoarchaeota archaeon]